MNKASQLWVFLDETLDPDAPPDYEPPNHPTSDPSVGAEPLTDGRRANDDVRSLPPTSNCVYIDRPDGSIKGVYVIDPSLSVPECLSPPLDQGGVRPNLVLKGTRYPVDVDVHLVLPVGAKNVPDRVVIEVESYHAPTTVRLVKHGKSTLSEPVSCTTQTYFEVQGKSVSFMGEPAGDGWDATGKHWLGSTVQMSTTHFTVGVWYIDELER